MAIATLTATAIATVRAAGNKKNIMKKITMLLPKTSSLADMKWTHAGVDFVLTVQTKQTYSEEDGQTTAEQPQVKTLVLRQADIDVITLDVSKGYTVWAAYKDVEGIAVFENIYSQTLTERLSLKQFFRRKEVRAYALLVVPPCGMEPVLILEADSLDAFAELDVDQHIEQASSTAFIASGLPEISLTVAPLSDTTLTLTATSSSDIDGAELRWETTGGTLDMTRTTFVGNTASNIITKPVLGGGFKVKCGFKYFPGVAEVGI